MTGARLATVTPQEWPMVMQQAQMLVKTGFLPPTINSPEKAVAIMMKGRELGVPPMYALSNIAVISGKPACTAELMLALIYRDHGDAALQVTETTPRGCTAAYKRRGWKEAQTFAFTLEDAKTAGLSGGNWAKYPAAMLRARCISAIARMAFPDSIGGMYIAEELGAVVSAETGEIVGVAPTEAPEPAAPAGPVPVSPGAILTGRDPDAEAEAAEAQRQRSRLEHRYEDTRAEAEEYGIESKPLSLSWDDATIIHEGKALRGLIEMAKAGGR